MSFIAVGTNHIYSPIAIRERLAFSKKSLSRALQCLITREGIDASVILSTCNRVELYARSRDADEGIRALKGFLSDYHHQRLATIEPYLYTHTDREAVIHLFRVASGIDSQIAGEPQILDQVRFAYEEAERAGCTDDLMKSTFSRAIEVGIRSREETEIAEGETSIGNIALNLIREKLGTLKDKKILIIGVGKVAESLTQHLKRESIEAIVFVSNRTLEKARELAWAVGGQAVNFAQLKQNLKEADAVISATGSPHIVIKKEDIAETISHKQPALNQQPFLIVDLAVPRDVDPEVKQMEGVALFCLDDLDSIIRKTVDRRKQEIPRVLRIIREEVEDLCLPESLELEPEPALLL